MYPLMIILTTVHCAGVSKGRAGPHSHTLFPGMKLRKPVILLELIFGESVNNVWKSYQLPFHPNQYIKDG